MPIRASLKPLYPPDWPAISHRIRFVRAGGRCECQGECGRDHGGRCPARHGEFLACRVCENGLELWFPLGRCPGCNGSGLRRSKVVLTTAHIDHDPRRNGDDNLRAMCARCHINHDRARHAAMSKITRDERAGQERFAFAARASVERGEAALAPGPQQLPAAGRVSQDGGNVDLWTDWRAFSIQAQAPPGSPPSGKSGVFAAPGEAIARLAALKLWGEDFEYVLAPFDGSTSAYDALAVIRAIDAGAVPGWCVGWCGYQVDVEAGRVRRAASAARRARAP